MPRFWAPGSLLVAASRPDLGLPGHRQILDKLTWRDGARCWQSPCSTR